MDNHKECIKKNANPNQTKQEQRLAFIMKPR